MTPREDAQAQIRAALDRHRPLEVSRRTLELIAEMSLRFPGRPGEPAVQVVDDEGRPRTMDRDGGPAPMTIEALVDEIRARHPALFEAPDARPAPAASAGPAAADAAPRLTLPPAAALAPASVPIPAPERRSLVTDSPPPAGDRRDWLVLGAAAGAGSEGRPAGAAGGGALDRLRGLVGRAGARLPELRQAWRARTEAASDAVSERVDATRDAFARRRARIVEARPAGAAPAPGIGPARPQGGPSPRPLAPGVQERPRLTPIAYAVALVLLGSLAYALWPGGEAGQVARGTAAVASSEPDSTGGLPARAATDDRTLSGVPEVVDTTTLRIEGRVVRLYGVEWARGGQPNDLTGYLNGREVECRPHEGSTTYRCTVAGQDLSRVVLYNGGGRTNAEATPDLLRAEDYARDQRLGVWKR